MTEQGDNDRAGDNEELWGGGGGEGGEAELGEMPEQGDNDRAENKVQE